MEALIIKKTDDTPAVHLDKNEGVFEFSGKYPFSIKSKTPKTILPVYTGSNGIAV